MLSLVLASVGLLLEGVAIIAGIDRILGHGPHALNVAGDCAVSCVIARSEGELDEKTYDTAHVLRRHRADIGVAQPGPPPEPARGEAHRRPAFHRNRPAKHVVSNTNSRAGPNADSAWSAGWARSAAPTCFQDDSRQPAHRRITRIRHCLRAAPLRRRPGGGRIHLRPYAPQVLCVQRAKAMEGRGINVALIPCFVSHTFLQEVTPELLASASSTSSTRLRERIRGEFPGVKTIGVLTSTYVQKTGIFEREFEGIAKIIYPLRRSSRTN